MRSRQEVSLVFLCRYIMASEKQKARTVTTESDDMAWRVKWRQIAEKYGLDRIKSQLVKVVKKDN